MKTYEYNWIVATTMTKLMVRIRKLDPKQCYRVISVFHNGSDYIAVLESVVGNE